MRSHIFAALMTIDELEGRSIRLLERGLARPVAEAGRTPARRAAEAAALDEQARKATTRGARPVRGRARGEGPAPEAPVRLAEAGHASSRISLES